MSEGHTLISIVDDDALARDGGYRARTFVSAEHFLESGVIAETACLITDPPAQTEKFVLDQFDRLTGQLAEAPAIFGEGPEDTNSAMWRAGRAICAEDLGRDDRRLPVIVGEHLMRGLEDLALADKIAAMAEVLRLPGHLRKIA
jgi:hypothetical protein